MHLSPSWGLYIKLLPHCRLVQLKFSVLTLPPLLELLNDYIHPHTFVIIQYPSLYLHFLVYLTFVHLHFYLLPPTPFYSLILIFTTSLLHITPLSLTLYSTHYIITDHALIWHTIVLQLTFCSVLPSGPSLASSTWFRFLPTWRSPQILYWIYMLRFLLCHTATNVLCLLLQGF